MKGTTIKPLFTNVLIKPLEAEQKTASGIVLPDSAKEKPQMGMVMAVGPGTDKEKMIVKPKQKVVYKKWAGNEIKTDAREEWLLIEQKEIMAVVES